MNMIDMTTKKTQKQMKNIGKCPVVLLVGAMLVHNAWQQQATAKVRQGGSCVRFPPVTFAKKHKNPPPIAAKNIQLRLMEMSESNCDHWTVTGHVLVFFFGSASKKTHHTARFIYNVANLM